MLDEVDFAAKCMLGPTLKEKIFEVLDIQKIKKIKELLNNEFRSIKREGN